MESLIKGQNIELLSKKPIKVDVDQLVAALEKRCGRIHVMNADAQKGSYMVAYLDHVVRFKEGEVPAQSVFVNFDTVPTRETYNAPLGQSWRWMDAKQVVPQCNFTLSIVEMMGTALPPKPRVSLLHNVVQATLSVIPCDALHWRLSEQFLQPQDYLQQRLNVPDDLVFGAMNVRMFNIQNSGGEMLMDTIGLSALGLPDIQCHFKQLEPNSIASVLYNIGYYIFENGDIINDGETVQGINASDKWRCQHEVALVQPEREVLDINPGKPYAAGNRE